MAARRKKNSNFMSYLIMGAGFAAGAAIVSVAITGITIGVNEAYKAATGKLNNQLPTNGGAAGAVGQEYYQG